MGFKINNNILQLSSLLICFVLERQCESVIGYKDLAWFLDTSLPTEFTLASSPKTRNLLFLGIFSSSRAILEYVNFPLRPTELLSKLETYSLPGYCFPPLSNGIYYYFCFYPINHALHFLHQDWYIDIGLIDKWTYLNWLIIKKLEILLSFASFMFTFNGL